MAGMFHNLEEVMEKLSKTEDQVKQLVKDGKLREFRDGANLLFKAAEVDDLANEIPEVEITGFGSKVELEAEQTGESTAAPEEADIAAEPEEVIAAAEPEEADIAAEPEEVIAAAEPEEADIAAEPEEVIAAAEPEEADIAAEPEEVSAAAEPAETDIAADMEEISDATKIEEADTVAGLEESDILAELQESVSGTKPSPKQEPDIEPEQSEVNLNIADITGNDINLGELTGADTNITTAGINVLAETEDDYKLTSDTKGETQISDAPEQSEDLDTLGSDLSLDSVGSGSGLLDLSLQADDTSLGAVLDDILPAIGEEPAAATPQEALGAQSDEQIFEEAEAEQEVAVTLAPQAPVLSRAIVHAPDAVSTACGIVLLLPLLAMIYAAIVLVSSFMGIEPLIIKKVETTGWYDITIIWYIMIALAVLSVATIGLAGLMGGKKDKSKK